MYVQRGKQRLWNQRLRIREKRPQNHCITYWHCIEHELFFVIPLNITSWRHQGSRSRKSPASNRIRNCRAGRQGWSNISQGKTSEIYWTAASISSWAHVSCMAHGVSCDMQQAGVRLSLECHKWHASASGKAFILVLSPPQGWAFF